MMTKSPSLVDVAARAGVSPSLVSRVLSGDTSVRARDETRQRVLAAADELGYVPHLLARSLRASRAGALGLVVHDVTNPIYGEIIRGAQRVLSEAGSVLLLVDADAVTEERTLLQIAGGGRVDGLCWMMAGYAEFEDLVKVAARHTPVVLVNSRSTGGVRGVHLDDDAAVHRAVEHLTALGHERIGLVEGIPGSDVSIRRRRAYRAALAAAGIRARTAWIAGSGWDARGGHEAATGLLASRSPVTAVLVTNAIVATGVISAIHEAGLRVPDDLSVVAIHDLWFAERLNPPLTVVRLPLTAMGARAAELLLSEKPAETSAAIAITEPAPEVLVRGSTAPPSRIPSVRRKG